ncbi:MAG: hypothetical protein A3I02_12050 [Betaproteobacteria bacterium RIFCSPLOWO2_02_FULL_67_26]|nr:MAG: hypothetical protein A3I02_12050 [Betaproteobacteria bacterium RIFCSPLOWO2_02_FULL_67_26]
MPPRRIIRLTSLVLAAGVIMMALFRGGGATDWRTASREPVGIAPDPATTPEAIVQVYGARAWGWRGTFGIHTWIAVKPTGAESYTVYELIGWRLRYSDSAVAIRSRVPDERWFGSAPELLADKRGTGVDALIERIDRAVRDYPYAAEYTMWPGPNSNTFTAWVARAVPELEVDLPPTAIGKDFLGDRIIATAPSGSGLQLSLFGLLGLTASGVEGVEINILGLSFGLDPFAPAIKLPLLGRLGAAR